MIIYPSPDQRSTGRSGGLSIAITRIDDLKRLSRAPLLEREVEVAAIRLTEHFSKEAGERAAELKKIGDPEGFARYALIARAITALQASAPRDGARLH